MKRTPRTPRSAATQDRDPLFNQSVEKAFAILEAFGGDRRALNLSEVSAAVGMTKSSAQRCTHTLERLGYLQRDRAGTALGVDATCVEYGACLSFRAPAH